MTTLVFDTETTGFYNPKIPLDDASQGRIVQLAMVLLNDDFKVINSFYSLIKPKGFFSIGPSAQAAHGISIEMCEAYGMPIECALDIFYSMYSCADAKVAHNLKFDSQMLDTEFALVNFESNIKWLDLGHFCTMREMTSICCLPGGKFGQAYKWPKLQEAYKFLFNKDFQSAHDALNDVMATSQVFKWLVDNQKLILPKSLAV